MIADRTVTRTFLSFGYLVRKHLFSVTVKVNQYSDPCEIVTQDESKSCSGIERCYNVALPCCSNCRNTLALFARSAYVGGGAGEVPMKYHG